MEKKNFKPYFIIIGLLLVSCVVLAVGVDVSLIDRPGIRMELPRKLGDWTGNELRFCHSENCLPNDQRWSGNLSEVKIPDVCPKCNGRLYTMSKEEFDVLPKDTTFIKSSYTNETGGRVFVSIVLSGAERGSIHRPQRCLPGQGHKNLAEHTMTVPLNDKEISLRVIESDVMGYDQKVAYNSYYAYWFAGLDRETSSHYMRMFWLAWDRVVRSQAHRWAYISVSGERVDGSKDYEKTVQDFVALLYPSLKIQER